MIVFKAYLKILKRNLFQIMITFIVFLAVAIGLTFSSENTSNFDSNDYQTINVGIIEKKVNTKSNGLINLLDKTFSTVNIEDDDIKLKDALFYHAVDYVVIIDNDKYESYQIPNSNNGYVVESHINNYLNTFKAYQLANSDYTDDELVTKTLKNLEISLDVEIANTSNFDLSNLTRFFNLYVYGVLGSIILGIGLVMVTFNKKSVYERTIVSKMNILRRNTYLYVAHMIFAIVIWLLAAISSMILFSSQIFSDHHLMFLINSFVFLIPVTSIAFMIGQIIEKSVIMPAINTVISLGLSFISGAFVPQMLLGSFVLTIASFTPTYWFILNNDKIAEMTSFDLEPLLIPILLQVGFAIAFISIGLAISKFKITKQLK